MAIREYVGARYVPRFTGLYDATQVYDALDVVDNGSGTSYIAKKTVPAGVPLTNTDYWFIYGATSGAILQLQNDVAALQASDLSIWDAINKTPKRKKWILIGDSFGCGIQGAGLPWVDGWIDYFAGIFPGKVFYYDPAGDQSFSGLSAFTTTSDKNFIGQLNYVYNNKLGTVLPEEITDIVVLGGSNELSGATASDISMAIGQFCNQARTLFKNAQIKIGLVGLQGRLFINDSDIYKGYKLGAQSYGCAFLDDAINLGSNPQYDSGQWHWNAQGYALYNPYIAEMILTDHCNYVYYYTFPLTLGSNGSVPSGTFNYQIVFEVSNRGIKFRLMDADRYTGIMLKLGSKISYNSLTITDVLRFAAGTKMYFPFDLNYPLISADYYYAKNDGVYAPGSRGYLYIAKSGSDYVINARSDYPFFATGSFQNDSNYDSFVATDLVSPEIARYTGLNV